MTDHEITQLALKAGKGDKIAMDRVIALSAERVLIEIHDHCASIGYEDQQDLSQELLMVIFRSIPNFKGKSAYKTWLWQLIHTRIIGMHRRRIRKNKRIQWISLEELGLDEQAISDTLDTTFIVQDMLRLLPSLYRRYLELFYIQDYSITEITDIENTTYEGTRSVLRRARAYILERPSLWQ